MKEKTKRHQSGRRPEITRNVYNAVRKYDRQSFEAWVNNIYDCGYEDGASGDEAVDGAALSYDTGHADGLAKGKKEGFEQGTDHGVHIALKAAAGIRGIGAKRIEEMKAVAARLREEAEHECST